MVGGWVVRGVVVVEVVISGRGHERKDGMQG